MNEKLSKVAFEVDINLVYAGNSQINAKKNLKEIFSTLAIFNNPQNNKFSVSDFLTTPEEKNKIKNRNVN